MQTAELRAGETQWWRVADVFVFGIWVCLVGVILQRHEPWADESQAWLIARDLDLRSIWFHELRYEGTPGLWHTILWIAQHWLHLPYAALGVIGMWCAAAGVAFILWKAPFPRAVTYLMIFTYVLVFQYAVVARSYNLLPLLVFAAAYLYGDRTRPVPMTIVLILLANVAVHGALLTACFGLCYLIEAAKEWNGLGKAVRTRYAFCAAALLLTVVFLFVVLWPTPDVAEFGAKKAGFHSTSEPVMAKLEAVIGFSLFDQPIISALFLLLAGGWCFLRRKLLPFAFSVSVMILFYVAVHGRPHHHGTVFLAAMAGLWIAWPTEEAQRGFSVELRRATLGMVAMLVCLFGLNIWDAGVAMKSDYFYPYSGSADAARFLKRVGADKSRVFGYTYGMSAVQAYFDHNITENLPTTYFHQGLPVPGAVIDLRELQAAAPEYVIVFSNAAKDEFQVFDPPLRSLGYVLVRYSDGYLFYKRTVFDTASYFIYRREWN